MRVTGNAKVSNRLKKVQTATYLDASQYKALKALSERTMVPMQAYFRQGIDYVLEKNKKVKS